ncbi:MAG: aminoglycoside phosphotransferase [Sediminibacterium sp.]|nr:aminoglycoside phosphotransferase [Sediminibacterium sp.]
MNNTTGLKENELNLSLLNQYLQQQAPQIGEVKSITRFTGGYSNLTYCLQTERSEFVLRMPPAGANIKSAHDMGREFRVLSLLKPHYAKVPTPIIYCESPDIIGSPFYVMEKLSGIILRAHNAPKMNIDEETMHQLSASLIDNMVALHALDIKTTGLEQLGKPDGYVQRQVDGWVKRYYAAETDKINSIDTVAEWIRKNQPREQAPAFLNNDYKYDNLLLDENDLTQITGVLDWEMSTVGDPLMDLGATLAYWFEEGEGDVFKHYNLSWLPGNFTRKEIINRYAEKSRRDLSDISFYYVFGLFKNAVIAQQIYHRWKQGHSSDARFGALLPMIELLGEKAKGNIEH